MLTYAMEQRGGQTKFEFLYTQIKNDIIAGRLASHEKLPSKRALAEHLGISVLTVENAYAQLVAEGYLYTRDRSGFYVSGAERTAMPVVESRASAALDIQPQETERRKAENDFRFSALSRIMRQVIKQYGEELLEKPPHNGCIELRQAICTHLLRYRGMHVSPEQVVIGSGAEYLYVLLAQLLGRERIVGIESPSYDKIEKVYRSLGVECELLAMDKDGIGTKELQTTRARVLHVTPYHSFPTGISTSGAKRVEYLHWAREHDGYIIEDDFDSEFSLQRKPLETIYSMDNAGRVIYINTFTKTLAPSMRMGYMVLPERLLARYEERLGFYSCTVPAFEQYVLAEFIAQGYFERHLNRLRRKLNKT